MILLPIYKTHPPDLPNLLTQTHVGLPSVGVAPCSPAPPPSPATVDPTRPEEDRSVSGVVVAGSVVDGAAVLVVVVV